MLRAVRNISSYALPRPLQQRRQQHPYPYSVRYWITTVSMITLILLSATTHTQAAEAPGCQLMPSASRTPEDVVKTVIEALRSNVTDDSGIAQVFCFASPDNKKMTGPIKRFTQMIRLGYADMLNHVGSEFEPIEIEGETAVQRVWLQTSQGEIVGYLFKLGKQADGEYTGSWMTDGVYRLDPAQRKRSI